MHDPTETIRRQEGAEINAEPARREALEAKHGQVWDTDELRRDFEVVGFLSPYVVVHRRSDGVKGSLQFQHDPRLYFNFKADWSGPGRRDYRGAAVVVPSPLPESHTHRGDQVVEENTMRITVENDDKGTGVAEVFLQKLEAKRLTGKGRGRGSSD
jgi:hypothetical protein